MRKNQRRRRLKQKHENERVRVFLAALQAIAPWFGKPRAKSTKPITVQYRVTHTIDI